MEGNSFNRKIRCCTCLSFDRNLKILKTQDYILLAMLCPVTFSYLKQRSCQYFMCWECEYMIIKIRQFQVKASKAQAELMLKGDHFFSNSLSNMETTEIETIDIPPQTPQVTSMEQNQQMVEDTPQLVPPTPILLTALKVDPETITIDVEDEDKSNECFSGDYEELIPPTKIESGFHVTFADPIRPPQPKMPRFEYVYNVSTIDVPSNHAVVATDDEHRPQKVFTKAPKTNLGPRGCKEVVKVTGGATNLTPAAENIPILVTRKASVPTMVKTSNGFAIVVQDTDGAAIVAPGKAGPNTAPINLNHEIAKREQRAYTGTNPMNSNAQF